MAGPSGSHQHLHHSEVLFPTLADLSKHEWVTEKRSLTNCSPHVPDHSQENIDGRARSGNGVVLQVAPKLDSSYSLAYGIDNSMQGFDLSKMAKDLGCFRYGISKLAGTMPLLQPPV